MSSFFMGTDLDTLWIFALVSKCKNTNFTTSLLFIVLVWLAITLLYWAHPGGPAWGKYYCLTKLSFFSKTPKKTSIPGPKGIPLFGSIRLMASSLAHHWIRDVAESFGAKRLMAFTMGETRVVVTCHHEVAKEILNSSVFADRPAKESAYSLMFNRSIGFAPYGVYWTTLRRIASAHLFSPKQIKRAEAQRRVIAKQMVDVFGKQSGFSVREVLKKASLNNMMCSIFGKEYELSSNSGEVDQLKTLVDEGYDLLSILNWTDHLSWLADFDFQKIRFRCSELVPKVNRFVARIISDHRAQTQVTNPDFVDVLLSLGGPDKLSDPDMIAVLWEMIFRGTDTVAVLIEWILARMVNHPEIQSKVHEELDKVVGRSRAVEESDIGSLVYLTAVVKEVLRLNPPGPLLSWSRLSITDATVDGYHVPKGTTAMVNMWAIARDPDVWEDPLKFMPERFLSDDGHVEFSVLGSDLRLAPFGSGRRSCPGKNLGLTTVSFWVASLLHEFEWSPSDGKAVDLTEVLRLSCEMANPLDVEVRPRRSVYGN